MEGHKKYFQRIGKGDLTTDNSFGKSEDNVLIVKTDDNIVRAYVTRKLYHPGIMDCHECKNPEGEDYVMVKNYECDNLEDDPV